MRRGSSIAQLGAGRFDGEPVLLNFGATEEKLRWNAAASAYIGKPRQTIEYRHLDLTNSSSGLGTWVYLSHAQGGAGIKAYSWNPQALLDAKLAYQAGLSLQEKIDGVFWSWTAGALHQVAVVWYSFSEDGYIDPLIVPTEGVNIGAILDSWATIRGLKTTGWINSPIVSPENNSLAPHYYMRWAGGDNSGGSYLEEISSWNRWVGVPS